MSTHNPDVIERVANAIYDAEAEYYNIPILWEEMPEGHREPHIFQAIAAMDAIDALYGDEGGEVPA